jgi:hypothetical protein
MMTQYASNASAKFHTVNLNVTQILEIFMASKD